MKEELIKINDHTEWHGKYKNVSFEIVKWKSYYSEKMKKYDNGYTWNFYIFVKPRKMKYAEGWKKGTKRVDYYKMYSDVEMHGDITYFSKIIGCDLFETHKIGCDFAHSWDYQNEFNGFGDSKLKDYSLDEILQEVKKTIDCLPKDLFFTIN